MSSQNDNFSHRNTFDLNIEKKHNSSLGLNIPENYFQKSKHSILEKTVHQKKGKVVSLYKNIATWSAVAVVALLVVLSVDTSVSLGNEIAENDILIASMLTDDLGGDVLVDDYVNDELLTDAIFSK
ncbi:MAG: hypothetical protein ACI9SI_000796 [Polaribacter sp.]|jgi:hypothetical protein